MTRAAPSEPPPDLAAQIADQIAALQAVIQAGVALVQDLKPRTDPAPSPPAPSPPAAEPEADSGALAVTDAAGLQALADAYCRVSRAVRLAIILQNRLLRAGTGRATRRPRAQDAQDAPDAPNAPDAQVPTDATNAKDAKDAAAPAWAAPPADSEPTVGQASWPWQDEPEAPEDDGDEDFGDILERPFSEIFAYLHHLLGLTPDWAAVLRQPWAQREQEAGLAFPPARWWEDEPPCGYDEDAGFGDASRNSNGLEMARGDASDDDPPAPSFPSAP